MDRERLERQFDFIKEIDKEKFIQRQTKLSDGIRRGKRCRACLAYGDHDSVAVRVCQ